VQTSSCFSFTDFFLKYHCNSNCYINDIVSVFSDTSFPGIAETSNGTGDAVGQMSSSVVYRGKTDLVIHKGKQLGNVTLHFLCTGNLARPQMLEHVSFCYVIVVDCDCVDFLICC